MAVFFCGSAKNVINTGNGCVSARGGIASPFWGMRLRAIMFTLLWMLTIAMRLPTAASVVAQASHRRKGGEDSIWEHPYQCTRIQNGRHLINCLRYVDINMIRAGKVNHPRQWRWCGYDELIGQRRRYRIIGQSRLLARTGFSAMSEFSRYYAESMDMAISTSRPEHQAWWTEAVAVGSDEFISDAVRTFVHRRSMEKHEIPMPSEESIWIVREPRVAYKADFREKNKF